MFCGLNNKRYLENRTSKDALILFHVHFVIEKPMEYYLFDI